MYPCVITIHNIHILSLLLRIVSRNLWVFFYPLMNPFPFLSLLDLYVYPFPSYLLLFQNTCLCLFLSREIYPCLWNPLLHFFSFPLDHLPSWALLLCELTEKKVVNIKVQLHNIGLMLHNNAIHAPETDNKSMLIETCLFFFFDAQHLKLKKKLPYNLIRLSESRQNLDVACLPSDSSFVSRYLQQQEKPHKSHRLSFFSHLQIMVDCHYFE